MADKKITDLTAQTTAASLASGDFFPTVDISDVTMGGTGTDKKVTLAVLSTYLLGLMYPVGTIYAEITGVNPNTTFGFGTWVAWGSGKVPVGVDTNQTEFNTVEKTGGEKTHLLTTAEMPSHKHGTQYSTAGGNDDFLQWISGTGAGTPAAMSTDTTLTGSGGAHNNLQPYLTCYFWKRTA